MAKSNKSGKSKNKAKKEASAEKAPAPEVVAAEALWASGDFNTLHKLAANDDELPPDAKQRVEELHERTRTDPQVWAVGVGAFLIAAVVAAITLGG